MSKISEFYNPTSEVVLLSKLLYEIGYIRFQKPLIISSNILSKNDIQLSQYQRFTDGVSIYLLDEDVNLVANEEQTVTMSLGTQRQITSVVSASAGLYHKIPLNTTYRKLYEFEVYRDGELLEYSQAFTKVSSDVSVEVEYDGSLELVVRIGNTNGLNIQQEESLTVVIFETEPSDTIPTNLSMIGGFDISVSSIAKEANYEQYLTLDEMDNILKYDKNINNTLVYDENYRNLILKEIRGINLIRVWQQEDEDKQNGVDGCNINKVFVSYVPDELLVNIDDEIIDLVKETVYGKFVIVRPPIIRETTLDIAITNNTKKSISLVKINNLKQELAGMYDDREKILSEPILYKNTVKSLDGHDIDIVLTLSGKGDRLNEVFYNLDIGSINITVEEREYL